MPTDEDEGEEEYERDDEVDQGTIDFLHMAFQYDFVTFRKVQYEM